MHRGYLSAGAILGALAVALGAFGAHGLENLTDDARTLHGFSTGVEYQMYHALALIAIGIIYDKIPNRWLGWAGACFILGIILFSGSLYLLTFLKIQNSTATKIVGPVTPLGGIFFIAGWMFLLAGVIKKN